MSDEPVLVSRKSQLEESKMHLDQDRSDPNELPAFAGDLSYVAFRAAFVKTLDCLLRVSLSPDEQDFGGCGFLDRIPLLEGTAPQVQLECLLVAWDLLKNEAETEGMHRAVDLADSDVVSVSGSGHARGNQMLRDCVQSAAFEELAAVSEHNDRILLKMIWAGPRNVKTRPDHWLYSKVRAMQACEDAAIPDTGSVRMGSACGSSPRELLMESDPLSEVSEQSDIGQLLEIVGRWRVFRDVFENSSGLLNQNEQNMIRAFFEEHPQLLREG
jgi:hypothetical protein